MENFWRFFKLIISAIIALAIISPFFTLWLAIENDAFELDILIIPLLYIFWGFVIGFIPLCAFGFPLIFIIFKHTLMKLWQSLALGLTASFVSAVLLMLVVMFLDNQSTAILMLFLGPNILLCGTLTAGIFWHIEIKRHLKN